MIDLTKPIRVGFDVLDMAGAHYFIEDRPAQFNRIPKGEPGSEDEAYRLLFEAAPKTLALLKEMRIYLRPEAQLVFDERYFALIREIEECAA